MLRIPEYSGVVGWCKACGHAVYPCGVDFDEVFCSGCRKHWGVMDVGSWVVVRPEFIEAVAGVIKDVAASSFDHIRMNMMPPSTPQFRFSGNITT